ncbi:hypothetical protein Salat_0833300 [Sesamum alatum]|uniref:Uncharacterized protein n=1 Tax=Sesamum alatum TaxID=300844 RepID=A0AAE2CQE3_9LAMI|nr:hypothetical protein Salat_0833300 [Sesamum alatum]
MSSHFNVGTEFGTTLGRNNIDLKKPCPKIFGTDFGNREFAGGGRRSDPPQLTTTTTFVAHIVVTCAMLGDDDDGDGRRRPQWPEKVIPNSPVAVGASSARGEGRKNGGCVGASFRQWRTGEVKGIAAKGTTSFRRRGRQV